MNLAHAKLNVTLIFLVSLVIITNCGSSDSSDIEVVAPSNDYIPELADFLVEVGQTSDRVIADYPAYFSVYMGLVALGDITPSQKSFSRFIADNYSPGSGIASIAYEVLNRITKDLSGDALSSYTRLFTDPVDSDQAFIGCVLAFTAAPVRFGSLTRFLGTTEEKCPGNYSKWVAQTRLGETDLTWNAWMSRLIFG